MRFISHLKPDSSEPKGTFNYTNLGYNILAIWFDEEVQGGWSKALENFLFTPALMRQTTANVDNARCHHWPIPKPYSYKHREGRQAIYMNKRNATLYSVGVFARPNDWAKFFSQLMPINSEHSVYPQSIVKTSQALLVDNIDSYFFGYGWGWMHSNIYGVKAKAVDEWRFALPLACRLTYQ